MIHEQKTKAITKFSDLTEEHRTNLTRNLGGSAFNAKYLWETETYAVTWNELKSVSEDSFEYFCHSIETDTLEEVMEVFETKARALWQ